MSLYFLLEHIYDNILQDSGSRTEEADGPWFSTQDYFRILSRIVPFYVYWWGPENVPAIFWRVAQYTVVLCLVPQFYALQVPYWLFDLLSCDLKSCVLYHRYMRLPFIKKNQN